MGQVVYRGLRVRGREKGVGGIECKREREKRENREGEGMEKFSCHGSYAPDVLIGSKAQGVSVGVAKGDPFHTNETNPTPSYLYSKGRDGLTDYTNRIHKRTKR